MNLNRFFAVVAVVLLCGTGLTLAGPASAGPAAFKPAAPEIHLSTKRDVAPGPKVRLSLNTRNLATVTLTAYKIDAERWLRERDLRTAGIGEGPPPAPLAPGKPARTFPVTVGDPKLRPSAEQPDVYRSKQFNLPVLPPGAYLLVASGGGAKNAWTVVNVTNLAVVVKRAPRAVLAWVTDHGTGQPVSGARVALWDKGAARPTAQGVTRPDGTCLFGAAPGGAQTLVVERTGPLRGPDLAGVPLGNQDPDGRLVSHLQTDRPVYRPGATVQFRAILRRTKGLGYAPEVNAPVSVEVRDSRDSVLQRTEEKTTALGTLSGSFAVPAQGALGPYSVVLTMRDKQQAYATFSVAEYRKPDFKVAVAPRAKRYLAGEKGAFAVQADYYFGAPLANAEVRYLVRRRPTPFFGGAFSADEDPADAAWYASGDGNLYERDTYAAEPVVADGTVVTDAAGRAEIPFATKGDLPDSEYSVSVTVTDAQRRQVEGSAGVPVYAAALRLGIRTAVQAANLNAVVPVDLRLADLDGKPAAGRVTLVTRQQEWDEKTRTNVWRVLSRSTVNIPATGKAAAKVPAVRQGAVEIRATVTDRTGRTAAAATSLWGLDPDARIDKPDEQPTVTLRLGRRTYQPSETADIFLTTSTPSRPTLLTVEGGEIFAYVVVPKGRPNFAWRVPATGGMAPNAHVTASQWARPANLVGGNIQLPVPDRSRRLEITVTPDRAAHRPGDRAVYTVRARDGKTGRPVAGAEVALAVVDESIFAVLPDATPDPYGTFWGYREDQTQTAASAPEEVSGGAYQRAQPDGVAPVREKFLDTAFWAAHLVTGPDGAATATVDLPGNLTAWRATALGVTAATQVGRATGSVVVSRPVMLRLAAPRQFVQGDALTLIGTVNNRTDREHRFEVTLAAEGVTVAPGEAATKSVTVPAKGEGKVEWRVTAATIPDPDGMARLEGTLIATDRGPGEALADFSDRLRLSVPVRPRGVAVRVRAGGPVRSGDVAPLTLDLPADRIEPASALTVTLRGGAGPAGRAAAAELYAGYAWGTLVAADRLLLAATPGAPAPADRSVLRDALALLSRLQTPQGGWGWWENSAADPYITARVLVALRALQQNPGVLPAGVPFSDKLLQRGTMGGKMLYDQTSLWEERAYLAAALSAFGNAEFKPLPAEVATRGRGTLSPAALLALAPALAATGANEEAHAAFDAALGLTVAGPESAYVPAGERPGWRASVVETTARALGAAVALKADDTLQAKLARWLVLPSDGDNAVEQPTADKALTARALLTYARAHGNTGTGAPLAEADYALNVNGTAVPWTPRAAGTQSFAPLTASVPRSLLKDGPNAVAIRRVGGNGGDEAFASAEATVYRPQAAETDAGMRVLRRFETQTAFGTWEQVREGSVVWPSSPVRVTVVVWPNEEADALRVAEPLPSGFEYVDGEHQAYSRDEVRDGAVLHYLRVDGAQPVTFRYYLRAESEGALLALPATGELIRRPAVRGGSAAQELTVREAEGAKP
jgi:uncharacterized protein YfaS (alpha-2-macroglobulin family)